jgi:adenylate cyclase
MPFFRASYVYVALVLAILVGATLIRIADPFFVQALRLIAFDSYQKLAPAPYDPQTPVKIVDIDEDSLARIGQWPWPRTTIADLLTRIGQSGAAVIAFDMMFSEPDRTSPEQAAKLLSAEEAAALLAMVAGKPTHDQAFAGAIRQGPVVLATALGTRPSPPPPLKAGFSTVGDDPADFVPNYAGATTNLPELDAAAAGIGSINWIPDRDQVVRRIPLVYRIGTQYIPTLTTETLRVLQNAGTYVLKASNASGETAFGQQTGLNHIRVGAIEIPTDSDGGIWLHFRAQNQSSYVPAWKVLAGDEEAMKALANEIVLVGTSASGLLDLRATPLDTSIPGVDIHAQAIEQILYAASGAPTLTRPDYALAVEVVVLLLLGLGLSIAIPRLSALTSGLIGLAVIASLLVGGWLLFDRASLLFDPTFPALTLLILVAAATTYVFRITSRRRWSAKSSHTRRSSSWAAKSAN